ncbi:MAG: VWA domain-containing protein [Nocardioidaceae bacterium]|nr:VWA domain-containing protein [Nocardioidaceae bacterium]
MKFSAQLDVNMVAVEATDEVSLLLDLQSPAAATDEDRASATLQVVLDRSGSMSGGPLQGAIEALCGLVARLDERDNFGVVVFDDAAQVVVPAGLLTNKERVLHQLQQIVPGGMTDLSGGYLRGLQELKRAAAGGGGTLMLISDGHANAGVTDPMHLEKIAAQASGDRIVTTTLGYGLGYDESALSALARGGSGNHHFAEDPDRAGAAIATEAGELLAKSVQAASLLITMEPSVSLLKLYNDLPSTQLGDGKVMVEIGDFYSSERRKLLVRLAVPAMAGLGLAQIASLELRYVELPGLVEQVVTLPVQVNVVPGDEAAGRVADPTVQTEVLFQEAQQAKKEASEALERGDRTTAATLLTGAEDFLGLAMQAAPAEMQSDIAKESFDVGSMKDRASWDDVSRLSKDTRASFHERNRKRGRD